MKESDIAAELVDNKTLDVVALLFIQQLEGADKRSHYSAPVDISHQQHRRFGHSGYPHIGDFSFLEVYLRRTTGAFDDDDVIS